MNTQTRAKKILIVGPAWVGDMVMTQTLFKLLKQQNPEATLDVLAPAWSFPLLERMPEVNQAWEISIAHQKLALATRYRIAKKLAKQQYDQAILIPNSFKSALIPWWAGIPLRTGWRGEHRWGLLNDLRCLDKKALPLMIQRCAALGLPKITPVPDKLPRPKLCVDPKQVAQVIETFQLDTSKPVLALCPGAEFGEAKRWPEAHYAEVARTQLDAGWSVWLLGSAKDRAVAQRIQSLTENRCIDFSGRTQLTHAIDLLSLATHVVSNDSGLMHIASALQKPLVAIYGSTDPAFTPPLSVHVKMIASKLECSPCFQRTCPLGHLKCLRDLAPQKIITALDQLT